MPLYLIERTFCAESGPGLPGARAGPHTVAAFNRRNAEAGVTWIGSYVTLDGKRSFCLYLAPDPQALRRAAGLNRLPTDRINAVLAQVAPGANPSPAPDLPAGQALSAVSLLAAEEGETAGGAS